MKITKKIRVFSVIVLVLYMLLLVWVIALKCNMREAILDAKIYNQRFTIAERFEMFLTRFAKADFEDGAVNVLLFVPLGMLMPFLPQKHTYGKTILFAFLVSTAFEILQIINCIGAFTYIDIINNTAGGILGAFLHRLLRPHAKERPLEITFGVLISILIPTLIVAAINTITHIEFYL